MAVSWFKVNRTVLRYHNGFLFSRVLPNETRFYEYTQEGCVCLQQRPGGPCRWYCQPHPPTDEGTEKLCCTFRTAVVVVAPDTRETLSVVQVSGVDFSSSKLCGSSRWGTKKHATKLSTCTMDSRVRPTSRVYNDADSGLMCPAAAGAAAGAAGAAAATGTTSTAAAADEFFLLYKNEPKRHGCRRTQMFFCVGSAQQSVRRA